MLMIAALLIGFIIGWFLRRSATRNRYEREIDDLILNDDHMASELHVNSVNYENNTRHLTNTQDKITLAKQQIEDYSKHRQELVTNIEKFHLSQKALKENLAGIDDKIKNVTDELNILNAEKDEIEESQNKISEYTENITQKTEEISTLREKISQLLSERESLNAKIINENNNISQKEKEIDAENDKIKVIENEFIDKKSEIMDEVESSRQKALNYQYAVDYVKEAQEIISLDTIDKIISKNEETGMFTNLIQKLFSKSAKYITGGK
jgi:chromosome segregation ATPase